MWDPACVDRLAPPSWLRSPLGLVGCIATSSSGDMMYRSEQLLVFLAISWKMTGAQFPLYLLPVSGPVTLLEVDIGSVPAIR